MLFIAVTTAGRSKRRLAHTKCISLQLEFEIYTFFSRDKLHLIDLSKCSLSPGSPKVGVGGRTRHTTCYRCLQVLAEAVPSFQSPRTETILSAILFVNSFGIFLVALIP